ncbi:MAG: hypothetical protein ACR2NL_03775 [Acidimicrobiia bacterium]
MLWALTVTLDSCDEFPVFIGEEVQGSETAQQQAQEWADKQHSTVGCQLVQAGATDGVGKAQYREPPPIVLSAVVLAAALSLWGAIIFAADGWIGLGRKTGDRTPDQGVG